MYSGVYISPLLYRLNWLDSIVLRCKFMLKVLLKPKSVKREVGPLFQRHGEETLNKKPFQIKSVNYPTHSITPAACAWDQPIFSSRWWLVFHSLGFSFVILFSGRSHRRRYRSSEPLASQSLFFLIVNFKLFFPNHWWEVENEK